MDPNSLSAAVIEVKNCKDRLSHLGNPKLTSAEFADHEKWMRQLIEKSGFSKNAKKKYMANLCKLISSEFQLCCSIVYCIYSCQYDYIII